MGSFLPDDHHITDTGFTAKWKILQLNRNYPQLWEDDKVDTLDSDFGVSLIIPVDNYRKSMRSVKYAILFVALTFLLFFFAEYIHKTKIHPVHYLLVGIALTVFYTLLTALSEQIPFSWAYLIASAVIVVMIALFTQSLYKNRRVSLTVALSLTALYLFLFVILQMTDYALLFGSIGLVLVLAIVMYFSRKIDWYENGKSRNTESESIP